MNRKSARALILSLALLASTTIPAFADTNITRIAGSDRYNTALNVCNSNFSNADYVIIASGESYPDALAGGSLATQINAPILLSGKNSINKDILNKISSLSPNQIFILGGENTISRAVEKSIRDYTNINVRRISGFDRIGTNAEINELKMSFMTDDQLVNNTSYFYVNGYNFYDALYAAPYLGCGRNPVLSFMILSNGKVNESEFSTPLINSIGDFKIVKNKSGNVVKEHYNISGKNRYESSVKVAERYSFKPQGVIIVSGENYPDGLTASSLVKIHKAPIILTSKNKLDSSAIDYIKKNNIKNIIIVGGENSVSKSVENLLREKIS